MLGTGLRLATSLAVLGAELATDTGHLVLGDDLVDIRPRQFRRMLLTFDHSIQGQIPQILGDDEDERADTLVRLLRGTSEADLCALIGSLHIALDRLHHERFCDRPA